MVTVSEGVGCVLSLGWCWRYAIGVVLCFMCTAHRLRFINAPLDLCAQEVFLPILSLAVCVFLNPSLSLSFRLHRYFIQPLLQDLNRLSFPR